MSIKVLTESGSRSPYDKVIFNSSAAMDKKRHTCSSTSFPTTSSSLPSTPPSSRYALPEHSYSAPVLYTDSQKSNVANSTSDVNTSSHTKSQQHNGDGGKTTTTTASSERNFLTKITTHFVQEPEITKKGPQHQRVASEDDTLAALTTLPSPATSVHDFPAAHHVKHAPPSRKISSSSLNADSKNYSHHVLHSEVHSRSDNSDVEYKRNNHTNDEGSISDHHVLQQRLSKFGLTRATELIGHYAILKTIGAGSFSKVKLAIDLNSCRKVAIKMIATKGIRDSERLKASVFREVEILKYIDYPNIVGLLDTVETPTHLCLVLEYVSGGELFDYVNDRYEISTEEESKHIFLQLINILEYLHENGIVHRDLKLENILIDSLNQSPNGPMIKLTDFGLAKFIDKSSPILTTRCGSEEYAAPELISGKPYDGRKTDIWSLGIILYALLVGYLPFNLEAGQSRIQFFSKIIRAEFAFPNSEKETGRRSRISNEAKDLIKKILQSNPQKRLSLDEIRNHHWLKDVIV